MKTCLTCGVPKEETEFYLNRGNSMATCKVCRRNIARLRYHQIPELREAAISRQKIRQKRPEVKKAFNEYLREYKYGLTSEQFSRLVSIQNGACAICKLPTKKLCVDHNHVSGKVRELLCLKCNFALGSINDSPEIALAIVRYLEKHLKPPFE